jgi:formate-dependent nitrite reductase cytochrome c552 subunit
MTPGKNTPTPMVCPECSGRSFSWIIEEVQFGDIQKYDDGTFEEVGMKRGEVVGSDVENEGVYCTNCDECRDRDELVPADEVTTIEQEAA